MICSAVVQPLFSRKWLLCNVFSRSACIPRVRVSIHGQARLRSLDPSCALLSRATLAEQLNTLHGAHLALNTRGTHAEQADHARARAFSPPLFVGGKRRVAEIEKVGDVVCHVQRCDRGMAARFQASAGPIDVAARRAVPRALGPTPPRTKPVRPGGSSWGVQGTGNSNPAASVRRGVSTGVM